MRILRCALLLLWAALLLLHAAHAQVLRLTGDAAQALVLAPSLQIFEDQSGALTHDQVAALPEPAVGAQDARVGFVAANESSLERGFSRSAFWLRLRVRNDTATLQPMRMSFSSPRLQQVDFYRRSADTAPWSLARAGTRRPLSAQAMPQRLPTLALDLAPAEQAEVLVRVAGSSAMQLRALLLREDVRSDLVTRAALVDGMLVGGLLMLAAYSLVIGVFTRSSMMGWQSGGFLLLALYETSYRGLAKLHLWPESTVWAGKAAGVLGGFGAVLLVRYLYSVARQSGARPPGIGFFIGLAGAQLLVVLGMLWGDYFVFVQISNITVPLVIGSLLVAGMRFVLRSGFGGWVVLSALAIALTGVGLRTLDLVGALPPLLPGVQRYAVWFSSAVFALVVLAVWAHRLAMSRQTAQAQLIELQAEHARQLAQQVAERTQELHRALAQSEHAKLKQTRIMAYIGHDLRAPLATIVGYARLLAQGVAPAQARQARVIERSADYQLTLIEELLEYARSELHLLSVTPAPLHLPSLLEDIELHAITLAQQQHNRFVYRRSPSLPEWVMLDGKRLQQVLLNLLSNAAKFTRDGRIGLTVLASRNAAGVRLFFKVSDTGSGIEAQQQARILEGFKRAQPIGGGLGLGLFIARRIVGHMGGTLRFASRPGRGSRFVFDLQVAETSAPVDPPADGFPATATDGAPAHLAERPAPQTLQRPPAEALHALMRYAEDGGWSDIESWLHAMEDRHPHCSVFLDAVREALNDLDFERIRTLARR